MEVRELIDDFIADTIEESVKIINEEPNSVPSAHKRGKYFKSYTEEDIQKAIKEVQENKVSVYRAAKNFQIPEMTLSDRLKGKSSSSHGKSPVLSAAIEEEIAEWILRCAMMGDPRSKDDVLNAASELAKLSPDDHNRFKNEIPSSFWFTGFMKRHPNLTFRTPSAISKASANVSSSDILNSFLTFGGWLDDNNFRHVFDDPKQVGNGDESGFKLDPSPGKFLAALGASHVYRRATGEPKSQVSVMFNFLASGAVLPPQLILKKSVNAVKVAQAAGGKYSFKFDIKF